MIDGRYAYFISGPSPDAAFDIRRAQSVRHEPATPALAPYIQRLKRRRAIQPPLQPKPENNRNLGEKRPPSQLPVGLTDRERVDYTRPLRYG